MSIFPFPITIPTVISILLVTLTYYRHFGSCFSPDGLSLLTFKSAVISDPYNALSTWSDSSTDPCNWVGVICANISGFTSPRVTAITISDKNITGYLPSEIGALVYLRRLDFNGNFLSGGIPERLSNATSLHSINLSYNFSGELPAALCSIPTLQNLDVSRNSIAGTLPLPFRNCIKLERLVLSNNELIGEVPGELWPEKENLIELDLSGNRFSGRIPPEMGSMRLMTGTLNLSHNKLQGEIPMELGKLPAEVIIDLRENHLSGEIPRFGALENDVGLEQLKETDSMDERNLSRLAFQTNGTVNYRTRVYVLP